MNDQNDGPDEAENQIVKTPKDKAKERDNVRNKCTSKEFLEALIQQIRLTYPRRGRIAPNYLFTRSGVHRYRVNWWSSDNRIIFSDFIKVEEIDGQIEILGDNDEQDPQGVGVVDSDPYQIVKT